MHDKVDAEDDFASVTVHDKDNKNNDKHDKHHDHCNNNGGNGNSNGDMKLVVSMADGVLSNDHGDPEDPLHVTAVNGVTGSVGHQITLLSGAHLTLNADGSYIYDPSTLNILQHSHGTGVIHDTFQYTASDGHGDSDVALVDITVTVEDNNNNNHNQHHHHHRHHHHDYGNNHDHNYGHDHHQNRYAEHCERHDHHHDDRFESHGSGWLNQGSGQHDIFSHMPAEIGGGHGGHHSSQSDGWNNAGNHSSHHDGHGSMGGAALALAQLEHGSMHHNMHFH